MRHAVALLLTAATLTACSPAPAASDGAAAPAAVAAPQAATAAAAAAAPTPPPPVPLATRASSAIITPEGLAPIRIGMSEAEALRALGPGWRVARPLEDELGSCRHIVRGADEGPYWPVSYMLEGGRVTRVEVSLPTQGSDMTVAEGGREVGLAIRSERGIGLGASEADVRRAYGDAVRAEPHTYDDPPARYLNVWTRGGPTTEGEFVQAPDARGIQFVTDRGQRVVTIHAGGPAMQYVEGCA